MNSLILEKENFAMSFLTVERKEGRNDEFLLVEKKEK